MSWVILIFVIQSILLDAIGDGFKDNNKKEQGHLLSALSILSLLAIPLIGVQHDTWWWGIVGYILIRIGIFDPVYNITRKLPVDYIGRTSYWDKFLQQLKPYGFIFFRLLMLTAGIHMIITKL